ncbi:hypothetical protein JSE7799_01308 [Jannaschia seosinensis]|uniref:Uncharacterized protein n=1 Tax=Jannaschia seosinensis TaxID=313367 RepID=A0A0M7B9V6_9RHOB|nr:hypothetical protein [Jannaschia seosinensis]CUH37579.1 hypothetical protein JSE7799_01308 [Jannaschia seosinensis]
MPDPCHDRPSLDGAAHLLTGTALVALGAELALILPPVLVCLAMAFALLRICWLEDNIKSDLVGRTELPPNHANPARRRQAMAWRVFGIAPQRDAGQACPDLVATAMRGQIQAWMAVVLGALTVLAARDLALHPLANFMLGGGILALALMRAEALRVTLLHLQAGRALPPRALLPVRPWAHSYRVDPEE